MNIQNIITEIEKTDPEVFGRLDSRRSAMKSFARMGGKIALAAVPLALGSMFKKAYSQTTTDIEGVLQYALTLEYLEYEFYMKGAAANNLVPAGAAAGALRREREHRYRRAPQRRRRAHPRPLGFRRRGAGRADEVLCPVRLTRAQYATRQVHDLLLVQL